MTAPVALPFIADDAAAYRRSEGGQRGQSGFVANALLGALALLSTVGVTPRAVAASPVWQRHQIQVDIPTNLLMNTLAPPPAATHYTIQNDWPVVTKARVIQDTNVPNVTAATLPIVVVAAQSRPPLITHVAQRHQIQVDIPANLLTTLYAPLSLPFSQGDWPVQTKGRVIQDTNVPNTALLQPLTAPLAQFDWPIVTKARVVQETNLYNGAIYATIAAPFAQFDWPVQTKARVVQDTNVPNTALGQPLTSPVNQTDWPVVTKARVVQDTNVYNIAVGTGLTKPFAQFDWPVVTKARVAQDTNIAQGAIYGTLAVPLAQFDWPLITKARVVQDTNVPNLLIAAQLSQPVRPPDFAPAVKRKDGQLDVLPNLSTSTLAIPPTQFPFGLTDWPVITKARVVQETNLYNAVIYPTLSAPVVPQDFGQVWKRRDGQADPLPNATLAVPPDVEPFVQVDWPVQTKARVVQDTNVPNMLIGATLTAPVRPVDFGQVWRRKDGQLDLGPNAALTTLSLPAVQPPKIPDLSELARKGRSAQALDYFGNASALLAPAQLLPFANPDLAVLFKRKDVQADAPPCVSLLLSATPLATLDLAQVASRKRPQTETSVNLLSSTLATPTPFSLRDWTMLAKSRAVQDTNAPNALIYSLANRLAIPQDFGQWQRRKDGQVDVLPNATATTLRLFSVKPFLQLDWPSPSRGKFWQPDYTTNLFSNTLSGRLVGEARFIIEGSIRPFTISRGAGRAFDISREFGRAFEVSAIMSQTFDTKDPAESVRLTFDFGPDLSVLLGITLASVTSVGVVDQLGSDPSPRLLLNGNPALDPTSTKVIVPVTGGLNKSKYNIRVLVATTDPFTTLELTGVLPVSV